MNRKLKLAIVAFAAGASVLAAQETPATTSTTTTQATTQNPDGSTTTQTTTVTGEVVQYQPGQTIVVRDAQDKVQTYTLDSSLAVPNEIQVGRRITVYSSPVDGTVRVQRISLVEATAPDGSKQTRTEVRDEPRAPAASPMTPSSRQTTTTTSSSSSAAPAQEAPAASTQQTTTRTTKTTSVSGTVKAYEPGQSITVVGPGNKVTTYTITTDSTLPQDVAVGKTVTVQTTMVSGKPVVRSVTSKTTTTTKTTKAKTVSPQ
jgi:hypothetical protein